MAGAWVVQQRTGNSGWVDTIWTFSLGLVGAGSALWPWGWATLLAPAFMYWILVHVTGVSPRKSRCCARAAIAIATTSRARAGSFAAADEGRDHVSFVATMIGAAPLPDIIIRAAILRLCSRSAAMARTHDARSLMANGSEWGVNRYWLKAAA
jgi:hypothetical protein